MTFEEYQKEASKTAVYPNIGDNYIYPLLGLVGESGEVVEKIKKVMRNDDGNFTPEKIEAIKAELGDVLWYFSQLCVELGIDFQDVATYNLAKLADRKERNVLKSEGDNR